VNAVGAGTYLYAPDEGSDTLSIIDSATGSVAATVPVPGSPTSVAVSPNGQRAYVPTLRTPCGFRPGRPEQQTSRKLRI
jgi:YVTN family beta-propeller protein